MTGKVLEALSGFCYVDLHRVSVTLEVVPSAVGSRLCDFSHEPFGM